MPEHPEPPAGLIRVLIGTSRARPNGCSSRCSRTSSWWALTDSAVPWFMGRIVTLVTTVAARPVPGRDLAARSPAWRLVVLVARPSVALLRYLITNQAIAAPFTSLIRWQSHWHVVRQSWAFFQDDFAGRISNW